MTESPKKFDDYREGFDQLYGHIDDKRSLEEIWLRLVESASAIGEQVRESNEENQRYHKILNPTADVFCWLTNFVHQCNTHDKDTFHLHSKDRQGAKITGTAEWIVWRKYPGYCTTCDSKGDVKPNTVNGIDCWPCQCHSKTVTTKKEDHLADALAYAENHLDERPRSVDEMVKMLNDGIYGQKYKNYSLEFTTFHFLEEVGEVSEQIRKLQGLHIRKKDEGESDELVRNIKQEKDHFRRELADVYSWIAAIIIQLNNIKDKTVGLETYSDGPRYGFDNNDIVLSEVINSVYVDSDSSQFECPTCGKNKCEPELHEADFVYA